MGESAPSQIFSIDWLVRPFSRLDFTGQFFQGENVGVVGGLRQGVTILNDQAAIGRAPAGGWAQVKFRFTQRLSMNFYGGQEDDRNRDLLGGADRQESDLCRQHDVPARLQCCDGF